ncbi:hypothetical protein BOX15_Mlig007219g1 [Macrostomum lignano]|uniref:DUF4795 domain-containing protein n=1 Tax=Macrostomum lignano TaxID=282301 RepID=A0A267EEH7_9PLAT|nr:hypothetical protein BOX15_Mlig007219g1 [Macrostomum lignano]
MAAQAEVVNLSKLVDMAVGSPEQGAVNFNLLHGLLHAIVEKLNDPSVSTDRLMRPQSEAAGQPAQVGGQKSAKSRRDLDGTESVVTTDSGLPRDGTFGSGGAGGGLNSEQLLDRLSNVETQLDALNSLPSGKDVFDQVFGSKGKSDGRATADMFQMVQMRRRTDANEEGVARLSSLVDELMKEMGRLRKENENLRSEMKDLSSMKSVWERLAQLESQLSELRDSMQNLPTKEMFKDFVTWESLEKALRGIREDMARMANPPERVVVNMSTDPMSRPQSPGPSEALREMLESLGKLTNRHESLEVRVDKLEHEMPNKADKKDLENLKLPDDLLKQLNDLRSLVDNMRQSRDRDVEALNRIRKALSDQQKELERINTVLEALAQGGKDVGEKLQELFRITAHLDEVKADKDYLDQQLESKADKIQLDTKVNFSLFDETTGNLNSQIDELLQKLMATEDDLRRLLKLLGADLDGKLDRLEMDALKDWLEKRLKALAAKIKSGGGAGVADINEDDAAGLRRQLLQHFHCISCDRPLEMGAHPPAPSLPEKPALSVTKSMRPYTTFELDSIRQHAKSVNAGEMLDAYYTPRAAGGSHTLTYPSKRVTRTAAVPEEDYHSPTRGAAAAAAPPNREETEIQGMDGHIYKGRIDRFFTEVRASDEPPTKLPPVSGAKSSASRGSGTSGDASGQRPSTSGQQQQQRPHSSRARPVSARSGSEQRGGGGDPLGPAPTPSVVDVPGGDVE